MSLYYKWNKETDEISPCDLYEFGSQCKDKEARRVAFDKVGDHEVSTVFLGLNHSYGDDGPPILFETLAFNNAGGSCEEYMERYYTARAAREGHKRICELLESKRKMSEEGV